MSKVDLGEMQPDYSSNAGAIATEAPKKQIKTYPTIYIKNPEDLGITPEMVGDKIHLEFDCRIKSVELMKRKHINDKETSERNEVQLELMQAYTEADEEEGETGDSIQDGISKGIKDLSDSDTED